MREANERGEVLSLTEDEIAFYEALETNDSAVKVLGDETQRTTAWELAATVLSTEPLVRMFVHRCVCL